MIVRQQIGIKDSFKIIKKSENPIIPLIEGLVNSFDSIKQRQALATFTPYISITLNYDKDLLDDAKSILLKSISIEDNGIGFTDECFQRFKNLADGSKLLNNRGTGKIQMFHRFESISVNSFFSENGSFYNVNFKYSINDILESNEPKTLVADYSENRTIVTLDEFYGSPEEQEFFVGFTKDIDVLKKEIFKYLLLRLYFEKETGLSISIKININGNEISSTKISPSDVPSPYKTEDVFINRVKPCIDKSKSGGYSSVQWEVVDSKTKLSLTTFKLPNNEIDGNGVFLCSKSILIERYKFPILRKNASYEGFRYITSIGGDLLDDSANVNQSADGFNFPAKKQVENKVKQGELFESEQTFIFWEDIKDSINNGLSNTYSHIAKLKEDKNEELLAIAKKFGISSDTANNINIKLSDTKREVTEKLFEAQAKHWARQNMEIQETYEEIIALDAPELNPFDEEYEKKFAETSNKLLSLIPQQNKDELSRYVIRRQMLVEMLRIALKREMQIQKEWKNRKDSGEKIKELHEALIHEMIFKRKAKGTSNDLWILNEEFVHFDGCSDLPLHELEVNGKKLLKSNVDINDAMKKSGLELEGQLKNRPDIFLFPGENKCVLIEFKAPEVDITKHLDQIAGYAKLISNFSTLEIRQFYGYLIGETIDKTKIPGRYKKSISCNHWFYPNEEVRDVDTDITKADLYQEIIPFSTLANRAELRNKSFAERLGVYDKLKESIDIIEAELKDKI